MALPIFLNENPMNQTKMLVSGGKIKNKTKINF